MTGGGETGFNNMRKINLCPICGLGRYKEKKQSFFSIKNHIIGKAKSEMFEKGLNNKYPTPHFNFYRGHVCSGEKRVFDI